MSKKNTRDPSGTTGDAVADTIVQPADATGDLTVG